MSEDNKPTTQRRWKNYFIYPRFQGSLVGFNLAILVGALGLVYYQISKSFWVIENYAKSMGLGKNNEYIKVINFHIELIEDAILTAAIVCTVIITMYNLIFSHKSAGAVYRLKTYFENIIKNGHSGDLTFRDGDMHADVPKVVNDAIKKIKEDCIQQSK